MKYIAHSRNSGITNEIQSIAEHLLAVSRITANNAKKFGLTEAGTLIGLLHDFGKYSAQFQSYIKSSTGLINQDEDEYVESNGLQGKIDHSTAGAQLIWKYVKNKKRTDQCAAQVLALCLVSHHSGLIDCLSVDGENNFKRRIEKADNKTHLEEILGKVEPEILEKVNFLISNTKSFEAIIQILKNISQKEKSEKIIRFQAGLLVRMLFSCLIDSDRIDSANFQYPNRARLYLNGDQNNWDLLIERFENQMKIIEYESNKTKVDQIRKEISAICLKRAKDKTGVYTLTVPTGGGKTLASLRFALHHAKEHNLDRIIYIIPFTSIIDQNAEIIRKILEINKNDQGRIVLEHHSNLLPEVQSWKSKVLSENWDAPIIFTTSVQFLETLFGSGTRGARRMHQLANAVIIFDEIQTLPIKTIHMFCNAINFLTNQCHSSVVLCTATQPLLNMVSANKGRIEFDKSNEIIPDIQSLFADLQRVEVIIKTKPQGWEFEEIANLAVNETHESGSCLIIVNTKQNARAIFEILTGKTEYPVYHLSTNMCPAHRIGKLQEIRNKLGKSPLICVSTQLIEAGVDVDFGSVIRSVAGLDSIAQAAGRCNRNGRRTAGKVFVINPAKESIRSLQDIKIGKEITERIFYQYSLTPNELQCNILNPNWMKQYYKYYFFQRANEMSYPVNVGRDDNLFELLSTNEKSISEYVRINENDPGIYFCQSFAKAAEVFKAIEAPTQGILVPYGNAGKELITDFFSQYAIERRFELLRKAQRFSVNVFPNILERLKKLGALHTVDDLNVLILNEQYYHQDFGLSLECVNEMEILNR